MSTTLRQAWLSILRATGMQRFVATSALGQRYVCHLGDFLGENPFYNREAFRIELELCAAWLRTEDKPVVFDVGANVGFWSTHLAQMLAKLSPEIYAFEPVPPTFTKLLDSVKRLHLDARVHAIPAAVLDEPRPVVLSYFCRNSLFAQVTNSALNPRAGDRLVYAAGLTLDGFSSSLQIIPTFIKIDAEGSEIRVLRGAQHLLNRADRPCLMFEYNPLTLSETDSDCSSFRNLLSGYMLHYVDDFEGQKLAVGEPVRSIDEINWVCNIFAVPSNEHSRTRWDSALRAARRRLHTKPS
jgi:FkbM family methyltransferase